MCSRTSSKTSLAFLISLSTVWCLTEGEFTPYGTQHHDQQTEDADDGLTGPISLRIPFHFMDKSYNQIYVSNDGFLTFGHGYRKFTPEEFPLTRKVALIAPYWADSDVTVGGAVWYRQTIEENETRKIAEDIQGVVDSSESFSPCWAFVVTWEKIAFHGASASGRRKRNTFQAVLATDGMVSYVLFKYGRLTWTTGTESGEYVDRNSGLGGTPALAGYNAGDGFGFYMLPGFRTKQVMNIQFESNVNFKGKWIFRIDRTAPEAYKSPCVNKEKKLEPAFGSMLGGDEVLVEGLCLEKNRSMEVVFTDSKTFRFYVRCYAENRYTAVCVTPALFVTGRLKVVVPAQNRLELTYTIINQALLKPMVVRLLPTGWISGENVTVTWQFQTFQFAEVRLDMVGIMHNKAGWIIRPVFSLIGLKGSNERAIFLLPEVNLNVFKMAVVRISPSTEDREYRSDSRAIWSDVFPIQAAVGKIARQSCQWWLEEERGRPDIGDSYQPCPCTLRWARLDTARFHSDPLCNEANKLLGKSNCFLRGQARNCMWSNFPSLMGSGNVCCYDQRGVLMDAKLMTGGGTIQRYHYTGDVTRNNTPYFTNFEEDYLLALNCIMNGSTTADMRDFFALRPSVSCRNYMPPKIGAAFGVGHFLTFDGLRHSFNGAGEFVLLAGADGNFSVQIRAEDVTDRSGGRKVRPVSVITAIAISVLNETYPIEVRLNRTNCVSILEDRKLLDVPEGSWINVKGARILQRRKSKLRSKVLIVLRKPSLSVLVNTTGGWMNILVTVASREYQGELMGLLGNMDHDPRNDLLTPSGRTLLVDRKMSDIREHFGLEWMVRSGESLFTHTEGESRGGYSDPGFQPVRTDGPLPPSPESRELCHMTEECTFDYGITLNSVLAVESRDFVLRLEGLLNGTIRVPACGFVPLVQHGKWTIDSYTERSTAVLICDRGYRVPKDNRWRCHANGVWHGGPMACTIISSWKTVIIWLALLIALSCLLFTIYCLYKNKRKQKDYETLEPETPPPEHIEASPSETSSIIHPTFQSSTTQMGPLVFKSESGVSLHSKDPYKRKFTVIKHQT